MLNREDAVDVETRRSKNGQSYKVWHFKCSDCCEIIKVQAGQLKTRTGKCARCAHKGIPYKHIYGELRKCCTRTKKEFNITFEEFLKVISNPVCTYCNKNLIYNKHTRDENGQPLSRAHQLDRKDNNKGYTKDNVAPCCWDCNRLKSDIYTYNEFMIIAKALKHVQTKRLEYYERVWFFAEEYGVGI